MFIIPATAPFIVSTASPMAQALAPSELAGNADRMLHGANVRRVMARHNMTLTDVVAVTGLDERTVRSILRGATRPQAKTLHKLAAGLGIDPDELFQDARQRRAEFDFNSNPAVARMVDAHPDLVAAWTPADFEELASRVAVGGELTEEGAIAAAHSMNRRRDLMSEVALILESAEGDLLREFISLLYRRVTEPPQALSADVRSLIAAGAFQSGR